MSAVPTLVPHRRLADDLPQWSASQWEMFVAEVEEAQPPIVGADVTDVISEVMFREMS